MCVRLGMRVCVRARALWTSRKQVQTYISFK